METVPTTNSSVIGVLYPGAMGAALSEVMLARGFKVITTLDGRSSRTMQLCERSGLATRKSLTDVVLESDVILSTVTPDAAVTLARNVNREAAHRDRSLIYVDVNSVSPQTVGRIADGFRDSNVRFVDAAIHGLASRLKTQGTIFASGPVADIVGRLFATDVRVRLLGDEPGSASMMKMMLGGMSKGIIGLFLQSSGLAQGIGMTEEFCEELGRYYPDVLSFVERSLPTYPQHAGRRAQEMREIVTTLRLSDLPTGIATDLSTLFSALDESDLASVCRDEPKPMKLKRLVDVISATRLPVKSDSSETTHV